MQAVVTCTLRELCGIDIMKWLSGGCWMLDEGEKLGSGMEYLSTWGAK